MFINNNVKCYKSLMPFNYFLYFLTLPSLNVPKASPLDPSS